jgi:hypothetical protein
MKKIASLLAVLFVSSLCSAQAAEVRLDGAGFDVIYDDSLLGLFGTPSLIGNSLVFNPTTFSALSSSDTWTLSNSTIGLTIVADAGFTLAGADLVERGDYLRFGAASTVFATGQTRSYDFRDPAVETTVAISGATPDLLAAHDLPIVTNWEATSSQTFAAGATEVHLTIQDLLAGNAGTGGLAFIEKKYVALSTIVSAVPEANQYLMLLAGLGIVGVLHGRKRVC